MRRLGLICAMLCALGLCACEPCQSISADEACARVTAAAEELCGKADACAALYKPGAPFGRCAINDRYCAADVDRSVDALKAAKDCASGQKEIRVNCFPE